MTTMTAEVTAIPVSDPLKAADRCDRCNAQAHVRTHAPGGFMLDFCGHHFAKNEKSLFADGWRIAQDTRETLKLRPADAEG